MSILVSLLRGVNMTGHNSVRMTELVHLYKKLGFADAETYIQSGNVIFSMGADQPSDTTASKIEEAIRKEFGFNVPVIIRTKEDLAGVIQSNPFKLEPGYDKEKVSVIFLCDYPDQEQIGKVKDVDYPPDKFKIAGKEIFIYCPNGFGRTKLYTNFFEKKMKVIGTARNWNSILTIYNLALSKS